MAGAIARKTIGTLFAACAVAVLALAAPASAASIAAPAAAVLPAASLPAAPSAAAPTTAVRIVLEREGGFAGIGRSFVVGRETADGRRSLRMAATRDFLWLRNSYQPRNPCCDRFSYRLTVTYRGGFHKTISTVQGAAAPRILWDVIAEVQRVGATLPSDGGPALAVTPPPSK
jgi:hypothetical protein